MGWISHIRSPWRGQRYTRAQAAEMQALHRLYAVHFADDQPIGETRLALARAGDYTRPQYSEVSIPTLGHVSTPLSPFVYAMVDDIARYLNRRDQRWFRYGYPNDPMRLFCGFLMAVCQDRLLLASCQGETLRYLGALQAYLEAIELDNVFVYDSSGHGGMSVLLHNLREKLEKTQGFMRYIQERHVARDAFQALQQQSMHVLNTLAQYLFVCHSDQSHDRHDLSIVGFHTTIDEHLKKALDTRAGHLLMQAMNHERVTQFILPQAINHARPYCQPATFLCDLSQTDAALLKSLPKRRSGIASCLKTPEQIEPWLHLHRLFISLAEYQGLVHACWQLAGFGGDQLIYIELAELMQTLMAAYRTFNQELLEALTVCHQVGYVAYHQALAAQKHPVWQKNYLQARQYYHRLQTGLGACDQSLRMIIEQTNALPEHVTRRAAMTDAYQQISRFVAQTRVQLGLPPQALSLRAMVFPRLRPPATSIPLTPFNPRSLAEIAALLTLTPDRLVPMADHGIQTLKPLAQSLYQIKHTLVNDTPSAQQVLAAIKRAQAELKKARARTQQARQGYYWFFPWHWSAIRQLKAWITAFNETETCLQGIQARTEEASYRYARMDALHLAKARLCGFFDADETSLTLDQLLSAKVRVFQIHQDATAQAAVIEAIETAIGRGHWNPDALTLLLSLKRPTLLMRYIWQYLEKYLIAGDVTGLFANRVCWKIIGRADCSILKINLEALLVNTIIPQATADDMTTMQAALKSYFPRGKMIQAMRACHQRKQRLSGQMPHPHETEIALANEFKKGLAHYARKRGGTINVHCNLDDPDVEVVTYRLFHPPSRKHLYQVLQTAFPGCRTRVAVAGSPQDRSVHIPWDAITPEALHYCHRERNRVLPQASPEIPSPSA